MLEKLIVSIVMGSDSDLPVMKEAAEFLQEINIDFELDIVSAHRSPEKLFEYSKEAHKRGIKVIIAGAGGAAHLPGMIAAISPLPVIGVPILSRNSIQGIDSLLSIVQMPAGVPVATVAINGSKNAAILAAQILATERKDLQKKIISFKETQREIVEKKSKKLNKEQINV